jgi:hypothetical protein
MAMVDYALEQGIADPDKLGVGGWSYGGISTDFIIAQTTRFKGAISGAGVALVSSFYGHDHYQRDYETELGYPWEHQALWDKISPFYRVKSITTPTLFMGGEIDSNVPILGSEQMYEAMKALGRATELVVYRANTTVSPCQRIKEPLGALSCVVCALRERRRDASDPGATGGAHRQDRRRMMHTPDIFWYQHCSCHLLAFHFTQTASASARLPPRLGRK